MPYDGELKFDTSIDKTGFKVGIGELGSIAQSGMAVVTAAVGAASAAVASIGGYAVSVGKNFEVCLRLLRLWESQRTLLKKTA